MNRPAQSLRLDHLFEQQVQRTPDRAALYCDGASITYAELKARTDRLLTSLCANGVKDGSFVGVHMQRSLNYIVSVLAILKANSAVVPLPPTYPENRLRNILSFAALDAIIDDEKTLLDPLLSNRIIHYADTPAGARASAHITPGNPDQPAFVLCSSGSTGTPKMIVRSHRSFFHRLQWTWDQHPYERGEVCCQKSHMVTTHAVYELFEPLLRGIPVHVIADQQVKSLVPFWETIHTQAISRLLIVPSLLQASLDMPDFVAPPLKVLVLMGEYVSAKVASRTIAAFPEHTKVFSIYGSTEASSTLVCDVKASFRPGQELPLGKPIAPGVRAYALGADLETVAPGEVGVLHIAGSPVFTGYFKDPALTTSAFATAPATGEALYNTHDQVRRMADDSLYFVGRVDHTVKIRGYRVDLQEVEKTLLRHPEVRQCAVILSDGEPEQAMLLAFVVPDTVAQASVQHLMREHLPAYMTPSLVVGMNALPLTASGKVDRLRLLTDHAHRSSNRADVFASETARRVAEVWKALLKCTDVQPDSSFFEIGGNSLTEFAAVHRLRNVFSLDRCQLPDICLYQFQTVTALAAYIDGVREGTTPILSRSNAILSTLKRGDDALPPVFAIASAGGTLGAYDKVVKALNTARSIIGVRDPFIWGERDATSGFQSWVTLYVNAIRERQPRGPYHLLAYSSAAAFGYEIAQHLRRIGEEVALLALIDPLATDRSSKRRFGYWALQARFMRRPAARIVLLVGWLRLAVPRWLRDSGRSGNTNDPALTKEQFAQAATRSRTNKEHILGVSALLELNTGLPFALTAAELSQVEPTQYLDLLLARVKAAAPEIDPRTIENIVVQYNLQVQAQHRYRLQRYDGKVVIFDPEGPYNGLLAAQFRPYVSGLDVREIPLGEQSARTHVLAGSFPARIRSHYLSMRDDAFANTLADALASLL